MTIKWTTTGLVVLIVALVIALTAKSCEGPPPPKIPPAVQATIDSLKRTQATFDARRDSVVTQVVHDTVRAAASNRMAETTAVRSDSLAVAADSLATLATVQADSAALWHRAFTTMRLSRDSLHFALIAKDSAYRDERAARIALFVQLADAGKRLETERSLNASLVAAIARLETPCRVLGPIRCPSRTIVMVGTAALTVAAMSAVRHP